MFLIMKYHRDAQYYRNLIQNILIKNIYYKVWRNHWKEKNTFRAVLSWYYTDDDRRLFYKHIFTRWAPIFSRWVYHKLIWELNTFKKKKYKNLYMYWWLAEGMFLYDKYYDFGETFCDFYDPLYDFWIEYEWTWKEHQLDEGAEIWDDWMHIDEYNEDSDLDLSLGGLNNWINEKYKSWLDFNDRW